MGVPKDVVINERHLSRFGNEQNPCINFLNHTKINSDIKLLNRPQTGGCFETKTWSKANERLGTAASGHHKSFLISQLCQKHTSANNHKDF